VLSLGLVCAGILMFLARLGQGSAAKLLFYNSDSLTMPLFARALRAPEGLGWISGPFLGVFPELPTFLLANSLTSTPKSALVLCGCFNIFFLYLAMRLLAGACGGSTKVRRQAGLAGIVAVTLGMAAETFSTSEWNLGWMLFSSTYYVGVSTMGVVTVALVARMLKGSETSRSTGKSMSLETSRSLGNSEPERHNPGVGLPSLRLSVSLFLVALLTTVSNPMFSVVVAVPCAGAIVVFVFARRCSGANAAVTLVGLLSGTSLGYLLQPLSGMVSASVEGYFHWDRIGRTATMVLTMAKTMLHDPFGVIELVTLLLLVTIALLSTAQMVFRRPSRADPAAGATEDATANATAIGAVGSTGRHFATFFVASWIILAPFALIITGPGVTRYFGTFAVFPFLLVVANYAVFAERFPGPILRRGKVLAGGMVTVLGIVSFPSAQATARLDAPKEIACVSATVPKRSSGIAEFWTARPIDIFNTAGARVLQATPELGISGWISNPAEFKDRDFTFVLTSWKENYRRIRPITAQTVVRLGPPSRVTHCGELDVYEYWAGSPGHKLLNEGLKYVPH
jgi:hypothetical protein